MRKGVNVKRCKNQHLKKVEPKPLKKGGAK